METKINSKTSLILLKQEIWFQSFTFGASQAKIMQIESNDVGRISTKHSIVFVSFYLVSSFFYVLYIVLTEILIIVDSCRRDCFVFRSEIRESLSWWLIFFRCPNSNICTVYKTMSFNRKWFSWISHDFCCVPLFSQRQKGLWNFHFIVLANVRIF